MKNVIETDLTGKVAVVTGASGTLCSIFAMALARAGAKVALLGRNLSKLNEVADKIAAVNKEINNQQHQKTPMML